VGLLAALEGLSKLASLASGRLDESHEDPSVKQASGRIAETMKDVARNLDVRAWHPV
jgi:hypothetical protein